MTNNAKANNISKTHDALTRGEYEILREAHDEKVRAELAQESEKDRQKRIWAAENAARVADLG